MIGGKGDENSPAAPGYAEEAMPAPLPRSGLLRSEGEVQTGHLPQTVLTVVLLLAQVLQAGQVIIQSDRPEADMLVDLDIQTAAGRQSQTRSAAWWRGP